MDVHPELLELFESELSVAQNLHLAGSVSPMGAFMDANGEVGGKFYHERNFTDSFSVDDAIEELTSHAQDGLKSGAIRASMVLFHGYVDGEDVRVAYHADEARVMVAQLWHESGDAVQVVIPYGGEPVFSPMPRPKQPAVIFVARTAPREGETTVIRIEQELFDLLQESLPTIRGFRERGTPVPIVVTKDANGNIGGDDLTLEALRRGHSTYGIVNHYFIAVRQQLDAGSIAAAAIYCYSAIDDHGIRPTEKEEEITTLVAWLARRGVPVIEMRVPVGEEALTAERVVSLPVFSGVHGVRTIAPQSETVGAVAACTFAGTGDHVVVAHEGRAIVRWSLTNPPQAESFLSRYEEQSACALSTDGTRCMTGSTEGKTTAFDVASQAEIRRLNSEHVVTACALDDTGRHAVVAFSNGVLLFWDLERAVWWAYPEQHGRTTGAHVCALSGDGRRALTAWPGAGVIMWDWPAGEQPAMLCEMPDEGSKVTGGALSAYGTTTLIARSDGTATVWSGGWEHPRRLLPGPAAVRACALSSDGQFALIAHAGITALWDAFDGVFLQTVKTRGFHSALAFSSNVKSGLLGGSDGSITIATFFPM